MNNNSDQQINALSINVDQWRRDINTFAETTIQALDVIVAQLSNSCSTVGSNDGWNESRGTESRQSEEFINSSQSAFREVGNDDRLAQLKSRLAERILRSN